MKGVDGEVLASHVVDRSIRSLLAEHALLRGNSVALVVADCPVTYRELDERTNGVARQLLDFGIGPGDTVGSFCENRLEAVELWLGAAKIGAVYVPVNAHNRLEYLRQPLADAGVQLLLVDADLLPCLEEVLSALPALRHIVVAGGRAPQSRRGTTFHSARTVCETPGSALAETPEPRPGDPCAVIFTAGTTGVSKGVIASHRYLLTSGALSFEIKGGRPEDVNYTPLPLFHGNAMMQSVLGPLVHGACGVIDRRFTASRFWERAQAHHASFVNVLGSMITMLWNQPAKKSDEEHSVRVLMGAPMPQDIHVAFERRFGLRYVGSYGLAEAWPMLISTVDNPPPPGLAGRAHDLIEVALLDDEDRTVPVGSVGEFACRPRHPSVMFDGYYCNPDATVAATRNLWFHTGDFGVRNEEGWFGFVDRKKDVIRRRGENISTWELEQAASTFTHVVELVAFAVPSEVGEDDVMVHVIPRSEADFSIPDFMDHCVAVMPYFAVPRYVEVVEEIPRSAMGKPLKSILRERGVTESTWDRDQAGYLVERGAVRRGVPR
jgi:crotonobetaine/carnitine-CoA ligase